MSALRLVHPTPQDEARYWRGQYEDAEDECTLLRQAVQQHQEPGLVEFWIGLGLGGIGMLLFVHFGRLTGLLP